jgi:hypothetical protein
MKIVEIAIFPLLVATCSMSDEMIEHPLLFAAVFCTTLASCFVISSKWETPHREGETPRGRAAN